MQTLSDLAKNIQQKTSERAELTKQIVSTEFQQHEQNLKDVLKQSEISITNAITSHEQNLKDQVNKVLTYKTTIGGIVGFLLAMMFGLAIFNLSLYKKIEKKQEELTQINLNIEHSPLQAKALARVEITQNKDGSIWITAKNGKKSEAGKGADGLPTMKLE